MTTTLLDPSAPASTRSPFVGLTPFREAQSQYFFGRERDTELLVDNLVAFELTVLYGPSGVGKSSILSAGVVPRLRARRARAVLVGGHQSLVVTVRNWRDDPSAGVDEAIVTAARQAWLAPALPPAATLAFSDRLRHWSTELDVDLYLILDQFEEYFLYHDGRDDAFGHELALAIADPRPAAHFLIALREDALAKLDLLEAALPKVLANRYRLGLLRPDEARRAITQPVEEFNRLVPGDEPVTVEPELVDAVVEQVRAGQITVGAAGEGRVAGGRLDDGIETAHLQLVMARLWQAERDAGSTALRVRTLRDLGGAAAIVRSHLDVSLAALTDQEREVAARVFRQLVTPSGTKIAHRLDDLATYARLDVDQLQPVLERLSGDARIVRPVAPPLDEPDVARYEIFHDALAPAVLDWRTRHDHGVELEHAHERLRRERRRRLALTGIALALVGLLVATIVMVVQTRAESRRRASRQLAAQALAQLPGNPTVAARSSLRAWDTAHTDEAAAAIRKVLPRLGVERVLSGHTLGVTTARYSPDGSTVVTASEDGTARLWDVASGSVVATLTGHQGTVWEAQFSPGGALVATLGQDRTVRLWASADGSLLHQLVHDAPVMTMAFTPDGQHLLTGDAAGLAHVWESGSGREVATVDHEGSAVFDIAVTANGWAVSTDAAGVARVWSVPAGMVAQVLRRTESNRYRQDGAAMSVAMSPAGDLVAIGDAFGSVWVWAWQDPSRPVDELWQQSVGEREVIDVSFSPEGKRLLVVTNKSGFLWSLADDGWGLTAPLGGHTDWALDAAFSPDGEQIVTVSRDGAALVRDGWTGALLASLRGHTGGVSSVDISTDGHVLTASSDGTARIWRPPLGRALRGHTDWVIDLEVLPGGGRAVSGGADGTVRFWDLAQGREDGVISKAGAVSWLGQLDGVAVDPSGRYVAAGGDKGWVWVWRVDGTHELVASWRAPRAVDALAFRPGEDLVAVGTADGGVYLWPFLDGGRPIRSIAAHPGGAFLDWSPDGRLLATGGSDGTAVVWDASTLERKVTMRGHSDQIWDLEFDPEGRRVVTAGSDSTARVWDVATGKQLALLQGHAQRLSTVAFDDIGARIVTGSSDGTVGVWDAVTGEELWLAPMHGDSVNDAVFVGDQILSASDDTIIRKYPCLTCAGRDDLARQLRERLAAVPDPAARGVAPTAHIGLLAPGTCLPDVGSESVDQVTPVDCAQEHVMEVIATFELPDAVGAEVPDSGELFDRAHAVCETSFADYVGVSYDDSVYVLRSFVPEATSWEAGDRGVTCVIEEPSGGELVGSLRGAGR